MAFQVVIDVTDDGRVSVKAPVPPPITLLALRQATDLIHGQVIVGTVLTVLDQQKRVALAPASALTDITRGNSHGAPI